MEGLLEFLPNFRYQKIVSDAGITKKLKMRPDRGCRGGPL